ncbi:disease resistance protein At4g27190-like [Gossypium raimondii]|uniref:disease resistance protein At4g27190-like n=1 Tax=Gossypium raimondii TaxID=29730 RepID=UPI00227C2F35|nr:disease resistance protein At4g27190-like [Gossypium raimondii]XP_052488559.1 disease resistance protein At4g27190-like [Gossypium raimondii]
MPESFFIDAATNAVGTLMVDYLVKPIERRIRYLFGFHKIVQELHEQQNNLNREQTRIQEDIKEAKLNIQTQVIEKYVEDWLTDATNALNNVQNLEARIEENKRCFRWCPNWSWRYQLSKSMDEEILAIIKLVNNSKFERIGHRAELPGLEFFTSKGLVASKSSTTAFNKIMKALKDAEINKIGVWGMGGVGKTTLVKEVGNKVKGFGQPIMVVVSKIPDIGEIQNKIADGIHLKFEKTTKDERAKELWCRLKEGKFIIILDDLWNEWNDDEDFRKIGIPLVENGKGCKIILTTRRWTVCKSMECQVTIQIDVLDDDEAWALFKMNANLDENVSRNIIEEAEKIVKECNGLPVAIVTLGRSLKGTKTQKRWELARKKLESSRLMEIRNIEEEEKNAYMCIKMSYEYLKKEVTKRCFLLCALYPEDHSIDVEDLVRYAWALELCGKVDSVEEVRIQVLEAIDYLKDSCLLLKDTQWYIKLHDLVRDVALWIASEEESGFMIKSRLELLNESFEPCRAISLLNIEEKKLPGRLIPSNLEILLLKNCDVQGTCFQWMKELKVLSLTAGKHCPVGMISLYALTSLPKLRVWKILRTSHSLET